MARLKTYENWIRGEFVLPGALQYSDLLKLEGSVKEIPLTKIASKELELITNFQRNYGQKLRQERLRKAKNIFLDRLDLTVKQKRLIQNGIYELEDILFGEISRRRLIHTSTFFDFSFDRKLLDSINDFYVDFIEKDNLDNYDFIASPSSLDYLNSSSAQLWAYVLYDLLNWLKSLKSGALDKVKKFATKKVFTLGLSFVNGEIYDWVDNGLSYGECAKKMNLPTMRPYISETFSCSSKSNKSIYQNKKLIRKLEEYCEAYGLSMDSRFLEKLSTLG